MNFTKFNLFLTAVLVIIMYFMVPFYNEWLFGKIINTNNSIIDQAQNLGVQFRRQYRFGGTYITLMDMKRFLEKHNAKGVKLLLPNNDYLRAINVPEFDMPEPAVFYYFTGINAVWANSPDVESANWVILITKKTDIRIMQVKSKPQLDSLITIYKKFIK